MRLLLSIGLFAASLHASGAERHVGSDQEFTTISAAIAAAGPMDTIRVHPGIYREGTISVASPLTLAGAGGATLDGGHSDEIIVVRASGVTVRGFTIRSGGRSSTKELAGIRVESAHDVTITNNTLEDCGYGIYLARARDCTVSNNVVKGSAEQEIDGGNGIHLWSCSGVHITGNKVSGHRDGIYLEFASESDVRGNDVQDNLRYGLHFMTSHNSRYEGNHFSSNGAGVAVMYSRHVEMIGNTFEHSWGGSAYGLLLKDLTDGRITGNTFLHNSTAVYSQGAVRVFFARNEFRGNGWALRILSNGEDNTFEDNNFRRNTFDVSTNGQLRDHKFARNYWDRYEGYDLNHDGTGDIPFRPVSLYSTLVEQAPASVLLLRSTMMHLLDRAEKALPSLTPEHVVDNAPSMRPHVFSPPPSKGPAKP